MTEKLPNYITMKEDKKEKDTHRPLIVLCSLMAIALICLSLYMHIKQDPHLGRLKYNKLYENSVSENSQKDESVKVKDKEKENTTNETFNLTAECLHCICMTVSGCRREVTQQQQNCTSGYKCSIYYITELYWKDGGALTPPLYQPYQNHENEHQAYLDCITDDVCATKTINAYMTRFSRDCNRDGIIDCRDYIAIHMLGPTACRRTHMSQIQMYRANECLQGLEDV